MRLGTNMSALISGRYLGQSETKLQKSLEKLSSGYKLNSSKDDSAGMAISEKMRTQLQNLKRASMSASDGISVTQTAEGALQEIHAMLQRINELAVQGANDTYTDEDRANINAEVKNLMKEIDRISEDTEFNNTKLLNGDVQRRTYSTIDDGSGEKNLTEAVSTTYLTADVDAGTYGLILNGDGTADFATDDDGNRIGFKDTAIISSQNNKVRVTDSDGFEMEFTINKEVSYSGQVNIELWDVGTMPIQVGANEGQYIDIAIPKVSSSALNLDELDLSTAEGCEKAITQISDAISRVSKVRSEMGAYSNRFEDTVSSLDNTYENMTAALSRIIDVDMADEMTTYTQFNVMQQAGVSMVAQANQLPEKVLQLLQ